MDLNNAIQFTPQPNTLKKVREFFLKDPIIKTFLNGMDKKDERMFVTDVKGQHINAGDRVVRRSTKDRCLFFVVSGNFFALDDHYPKMQGPVYTAGAVIGIDQFLSDDSWDIDLICGEEGVIAKFEYQSFVDMKASNV